MTREHGYTSQFVIANGERGREEEGKETERGGGGSLEPTSLDVLCSLGPRGVQHTCRESKKSGERQSPTRPRDGRPSEIMTARQTTTSPSSLERDFTASINFEVST